MNKYIGDVLDWPERAIKNGIFITLDQMIIKIYMIYQEEMSECWTSNPPNMWVFKEFIWYP